MSQVEVKLKSGKTISVMRDEVQGLRDAGLLKTGKAEAKAKEQEKLDKAKKKEEKEKAETKEDKGAGTITKANIKK